MKVLFAVSNESISEGIVKQYQKEYKEILSYKNVYYFNAILKEIQKDKTYDRIIISEELEPFSNNNYEQIDKFLFEKLDNISDEAQDSNGQETSIIFICTDRRAKGSNFLVKLFSIGVYNALLGQDRVKSEVCKLINKPRIKKEAKIYYGIDAEDAKYDQSSDSEVTELEINNIRSHFRKLGKNTDKYAESFNNIAVQYNDEQLRIIVNCLPINVKAVLEANSTRYQELMNASAGRIRSVVGQEMEMQAKESGIKMDLIQNAKSNIERPIVIPSSVKRRTVPTSPVQNSNISTGTVKRTVVTNQASTDTIRRVQVNQNPVNNVVPQNPVVQENVTPVNDEPDDLFDDINDLLDDGNVFVDENINTNTNNEILSDGLLDNDFGLEDDFLSDSLENDDSSILPGFDDIDSDDNNIDDLIGSDDDLLVNDNSNVVEDVSDDFGLSDFEETDNLLPGMDINENDDILTDDFLNEPSEENNIEEVKEELPIKKGRGRPRKLVTEPPKPKGKRGRPRKIVNENGEELPGMEYDEEDEYTDEVSLPGLDELDDFDGFGLDDEFGENTTTSNSDSLLPGLDDLDDISGGDDNVLPGMDFDDDILDSNTNIGAETNNFDLDSSLDSNDGILPGFDDFDDASGVLPGFEDDNLPGMDFDDGGLLPGFDDDSNTESVTMPGFDDDDLLSTFEDESTVINPVQNSENNVGMNNPINNMMNNQNINNNNNAIESVKSNIDYSMSTLNSLLTKENKIVTFIGTTKNGTSFLVNNLALLFDSLKINTAILDMTKNRNSYYIYTNSDEELRNISANAMENLERGVAKGLRVKENLTVYTAIPDNGKVYTNAESILSTLVQNHSLVLIDCDYDTDPAFFASCQEIYLVQSMDVLTIQPLTAFLKGLKTKGVLEPEKIRIAINKHVRLKEFSAKDFIAGMSCYNDPSMSIMTELFNREMVKFCIIDFEEGVYAKYLDSMASCKVNLNGYSKSFLTNLRKLGDMVYPLTGGVRPSYGKSSGGTNPIGYVPQGGFSKSTSSTLDKMRKNY